MLRLYSTAVKCYIMLASDFPIKQYHQMSQAKL